MAITIRNTQNEIEQPCFPFPASDLQIELITPTVTVLYLMTSIIEPVSTEITVKHNIFVYRC